MARNRSGSLKLWGRRTAFVPGEASSLLIVANQRQGLGRCNLCGGLSTGQGEHVLSRWFLRRELGKGGFTYEENNEPILANNGCPRKRDPFPPYLLTVCEHCNAKLNQRYEKPGKPAVRTVLDEGKVLEASEQVVAFARWWIKTILLLQHPETKSTFPGVVMRNHWDVPVSVYKNLLEGSLPSDASLWLAVADDENGCARLPELLRIYLPTTSDPEGVGGSPATLLTGFRQVDTRIMLVQLVLHPLCDFEHPFEQSGLVIKLWPEPPDCFDIAALPVLGAEGRRQLGALFVDGNYGENIPARGWRTSVDAVPDGCPLVSPQLVPPPSEQVLQQPRV